MVWLDLFAVQGTLKSLLQHHNSKASILRCSAFFIVQLSHPYMATGKTVALTGWNFVGKVMSLFFNMLSRLVIAFLPRSKRPLISWLQKAVIKIVPQRKKCKTAKWLSEEGSQIAVKRRKVKSKGEKERYTHLNAEFQRIARKDKKAFLSDQCKEIEENNRIGKTRDLFKKIRDNREHFMQRWAQ